MVVTLIKDELRDRKTRPSSRSDETHLTNDDRLFIIWCWSRGMLSSAVAAQVKCSHDTVLNYRSEVFREPYRVFDLPVGSKQGQRKYVCRLCGDAERSETICKKHVLRHFMPKEFARQAILKPPPEW
jgi:hypothetical protein